MSWTQTRRFTEDLKEAANFVRGVLGEAEVALVLGSGLNGFIDVLQDRKELPYSSIPHMPATTVKVSYIFGIGCVRVLGL